VCDTFLSATSDPGVETGAPKPFVFISAEDIFRPFIPARYIETKRAAERRIEEMMRSNPDYRGVYMRPSAFFPLDLGLHYVDRNVFRLGIPRPRSTTNHPYCCGPRSFRFAPFQNPTEYSLDPWHFPSHRVIYHTIVRHPTPLDGKRYDDTANTC